MVGLFIPGKILQISARFLFGAFNKMYLLFFDFLTALILNSNLSKITCFSFVNELFAAITASDRRITSASFKPFVNKVLPELTKSQIASAKPMPGAISTEPLISCISALILFFFKYFERTFE